MNITKSSIRYPVSTAVGVILLAMFGVIAFFRIPIQLIPSVEEPVISIETVWPGASPKEVEREITEEQEDMLKSLSGLVKMESISSDSMATITLTFLPGVDLNAILVRVANRLEQVPSYPEDVEKPVIRTVDAGSDPIAWFIIVPHGGNPFEGDIRTKLSFIEHHVKPEFERVQGIAASHVYGGKNLELQVIADPVKLAARGLSLAQLGDALDTENKNYSAGDFSEGKRRYIVRTLGEYETPEDVGDVVVAIKAGIPVYVRDVAEVQLGYGKASTLAYHMGESMIAMSAIRQTGSNVLDVMKRLKAVAGGLNKDLLEPMGLKLIQVSDQTEYINSAIDLVQQSLIFGGFLAILVLLLFLRSGASTFVVAAAIPISVVGTFLIMNMFGRTINVISLAGMAFAVGMVVDNSIVVLENIYRHCQMGKTRAQAAYDGTMEVKGAVIASTLTTIAVFVPVLFVKQEAGQLFRDIAIAISCAVGLSLLISITVIPSLSAKILNAGELDELGKHQRLGAAFRTFVMGVVGKICATTFSRLLVVFGFTGGALLFSWLLLPKAEYLPTGNLNFLMAVVIPPPGYHLDQISEYRHFYNEELAYLWEDNPETLPGDGIRHFFFVATVQTAFMGGVANDPAKVKDILPIFQETNASITGATAVSFQKSIFQAGVADGRTINVDLRGPDLKTLIALGRKVVEGIEHELPGSQWQASPGLNFGSPELRVTPQRRRAAELGVSSRDLGFAVNVLVDGVKVSEYQYEGMKIDLKVMIDPAYAHHTHLLEQMSITGAKGELIDLGAVAKIELSDGPLDIKHIQRQRGITLQVTPSETIPLQMAMEVIQSQILQPLVQEGTLGGLYRASLSGSADKLTQTGAALKWNFLLALAITYLLL